MGLQNAERIFEVISRFGYIYIDEKKLLIKIFHCNPSPLMEMKLSGAKIYIPSLSPFFFLASSFRMRGFSGEPYYDTIYPKMSEAIVLTMLAAQEHMDRRRCSFELYGADFMVLDDLSVWLIEINTNPRMHPPSSRITQRLYNILLESLVKG